MTVMKKKKRQKVSFLQRGEKMFKTPCWRKAVLLLVTLFFICPASTSYANVLKHKKNNLYIPQGQYQNMWLTGMQKNRSASSSLVEFDKSQFSLLQETLGDVSVESFQLTVLDSKGNNDNRQSDPQSISALDTNLFLEALSDSSALRTIYFNSKQLRFSFRLNLMGLIGDDLLKEELEENRRRQIEADDRLDDPFTPDTKSVKLIGEKGLMETLLSNMNSFLFVVMITLLLIYLLLRFFSNRI